MFLSTVRASSGNDQRQGKWKEMLASEQTMFYILTREFEREQIESIDPKEKFSTVEEIKKKFLTR